MWLRLEEMIFFFVRTGIVVDCFIKWDVKSQTRNSESYWQRLLVYTFLCASHQWFTARVPGIRNAIAVRIGMICGTDGSLRGGTSKVLICGFGDLSVSHTRG
jgi:hypothetical protein